VIAPTSQVAKGGTEAMTGASAPSRKERSIQAHFGFETKKIACEIKRNRDVREKGEGRCGR